MQAEWITTYVFTVSIWIASLLTPCLGADDASPQFTDVTHACGLDFRHVSPPTEDRHTHLTMGSGVGWIDYDRDGSPDLYFAQGTPWTGELKPQDGPSDQLFRQHCGSFVNVTGPARIRSLAYGMGVAVADFNVDGFPDLYVSSFGPNRLFVNHGDGSFSEQSAAAGVTDAAYGASCTWFDADADGLLDLFVTNYLDIDPSDYRICREPLAGGKQQLAITCPPWSFPGRVDRFFRNLGNGHFRDATDTSGFSSVEPAHGLGVGIVDLDDDGDLDLYVANDSDVNHQWMNDGQGRFEETALIAGTAVNLDGAREAGMGVAVGDVDADGLPDLFVTNYYAETNTLYRNEGGGLFTDVSNPIGVGAPSRPRLGFGACFLDAENDGDLDLFVTNGHVHDRLTELGRNIPFEQPPQLLTLDHGRFSDVSSKAGETFQIPQVGRGAATADFNADGRVDIVVSRLNATPALLQNVTPNSGRFLSLALVQTSGGRDAIGTAIEVRAGNRRQVLFMGGCSSYLSTCEQVVQIGLAEQDRANQVIVRWLGGNNQIWHNLSPGKRYLLVEGGESPMPLPETDVVPYIALPQETNP